jgi:hypothetical protein
VRAAGHARRKPGRLRHLMCLLRKTCIFDRPDSRAIREPNW